MPNLRHVGIGASAASTRQAANGGQGCNYSAGACGNYILDVNDFLESLPHTHAWLVTFLAVWWAVGYTITALLAWAFMSNFSCNPDGTVAECTDHDNIGWLYLHFTCGALVAVISVLRLLLIIMVQMPK